MKAKAFILFAAVLFIFFKCLGDDTNDVSKVFGGKEAAAIIRNADSAKAWKTLGLVEKEQYEAGKRAGFNPADFYRKAGDPILVSNDMASQLSKALLDKHSYSNIGSSLKDCEPEPGVVITFSEGNKSVDVFFCFDCKILIVNNIQCDFDPGCPGFLEIMKKIFPSDRKISQRFAIQESAGSSRLSNTR